MFPSVLLAVILFGTPSAAAAEAITDLGMDLRGLDVPMVTAEAGLVYDDFEGWGETLAVAFRGIGAPSASWASASASAWDLRRLRRYRVSLTVLRAVGETWPTPVLWDVSALTGSLGRDERLDVDLDASLSLFRALGGLCFPSVDPGDFDGRFVGAASLLGIRHRRYLGGPKPFAGAVLGGLSAELTVGARVTDAARVHLALVAKVGWSLGRSAALSVVTDSRVASSLCLTLGSVPLCVVGANDTMRDPANALVPTSYSVRLEAGWSP